MDLTISLRSLFHHKMCSSWLPNTKEQETNKIKSTCRMQNCPTQTIFHQLTLGHTLGPRGFALGMQRFVLGPRGILETNNLVLVMRNGSRTTTPGTTTPRTTSLGTTTPRATTPQDNYPYRTTTPLPITPEDNYP